MARNLQLGDPTACAVHDVGYDGNTGMSRCRGCGLTSQTLTAGVRAPIKGDFRVVCEGPVDSEETACAIGPSEPTPHLSTAREYLEEHQADANHRDGCDHACKIVQL